MKFPVTSTNHRGTLSGIGRAALNPGCLRGRKTLYDGAQKFQFALGNRMTARSSLTVVLAAGEGTRMRSSLPKVLHPVAGEPLLAHVLHAAPSGTDCTARRGDRTGPQGGRRRGAPDPPRRRNLHPARAAGHRACGAGGACGNCTRCRRSAGGLWRHAADLGRDVCTDARAARERRGAHRARLPRCRSDRLWPTVDGRQSRWSRSASTPTPVPKSARSRCAMPA